MNVLVTGGAGFIGGNFVRYASDNSNYKIVVLDKLTYAGDLTRIEDLLENKKVEFIKGDICDYELVAQVYSDYNIDKVLNFSAETHVDRSILGPKEFIKTNIEGTFCLLEAGRAAWNKNGDNLFMHISTDEVHGSLESHDPPFNEDSNYRPSSPYSASKAASDHLITAWQNTYGMPAIITKCSNNYGQWQYPEKLVPLTIINALEGNEVPIYGDGKQVRDWLHVNDHCSALMKILENGKIGETYTIGGSNERTNMEIVEMICDCADEVTSKPKGTSRKLIHHIKDRPGHDRRYAMDSSKLQKELNWRPETDFKESLIELVQWYIVNKPWADKIRSGEYKDYYEQQYGKL